MRYALGTKDFREITELDLSGQLLEDIRSLKKFTNLRELDFNRLKVPEAKTPLWKVLLIKLHIIKKPAPQVLYWSPKEVKMCLLNLRPLRNLSNLIYLDVRNCKNILYHQLDDLQKSLPKLVIFDGRDK